MATLSFTIGKVRVSVGKTGVRLGGKIGDTYVSRHVIKTETAKKSVKPNSKVVAKEGK